MDSSLFIILIEGEQLESRRLLDDMQVVRAYLRYYYDDDEKKKSYLRDTRG